VPRLPRGIHPVARLVAAPSDCEDNLARRAAFSVQADCRRRALIMRNHSGTHLVHAALAIILARTQAGRPPLTAPDRLRFAFSICARRWKSCATSTASQRRIRYNCQIETNVTSSNTPFPSGALAFFGDKYPNTSAWDHGDLARPDCFYSKSYACGTRPPRRRHSSAQDCPAQQSVAAGVTPNRGCNLASSPGNTTNTPPI